MLRLSALLLFVSFTVSAQESVPTEFMYHRVWAVVPLIGKGTKDDPRRPMFVPSPAERQQDVARREKVGADGEKVLERPAIIGYSMQLSADGNTALVEFIGADPAALKHIVNSGEPGVKAFERGKTTKEEIEAEFKKHKPTFKLDSFAGRAQ